MGYTHYWSRVDTPEGPLPSEPHDAYGRLAFDGRWDGTTYDGHWYPEWVAARRLISELFGADADRSPFPP